MSAVPQQMLLDWLSGPVMTELVASQDVAPGLPKPFPPEFYAYSPTECVGVNVQYDAVVGVRQSAPIVNYLSPAAATDTQPRQRRQTVALGTRIETPLDGDLLMGLQSNVPLWGQRAKMILTQKQMDFRMLADDLAISLVHSVVATQQISYQGTPNQTYVGGQLLGGASGASIPPQVSFQSLYAGTNALTKTSNWPGVTPNVTVGDWSSAGTDIPTSVRTARQSMLFTSNYVAAHCIYGIDIPKYFYNNTALQTYMSRSQWAGTDFLQTNEIPAGMLDLNWHKGYEAYYQTGLPGQPQTATTTQWVAPNQIIIYPEVTPSWYENILCSLPCPTTFGTPGMDFASFIASCPPVRGYSSYCVPCWNPIKANLISQLYSVPILKNPFLPMSVTVS